MTPGYDETYNSEIINYKSNILTIGGFAVGLNSFANGFRLLLLATLQQITCTPNDYIHTIVHRINPGSGTLT